MLSLQYNLTDHATPQLRAQAAALDPARLATTCGEAVVNLFRDNFLSLGVNEHRWPTTGFWPAAAEATNYQRSGDGITITVDKVGVRQRWLGGRIEATNAKALTIPVSAEAYGHTATDFPEAFLIKTSKGAFLVRHASGPTEYAGLDFLFKLRTSVFQEPCPQVLPSNNEIMKTAHAAIARASNPKLNK